MYDCGTQGRQQPVCSVWQVAARAMLAMLLPVSIALVARYPASDSHELEAEVQNLKHEVQRLKQEQTMPSLVLNRYRNSICYIFGIYQVGFDGRAPDLRVQVSGTGFAVGDGLLATNRHIAEPWFQDPDAAVLIRQGATAHLKKLIAFFPGLPKPLDITTAALSSEGDLAVLRIENSQDVRQLSPLPLASAPPKPGDLVLLVGYPMGVFGMLAKSPRAVYENLSLRRDEQRAASELATLSLIRPSATCGHLGDVVGDRLIYDAPTAHGASGGPVFNSQGEVIGVNAAYVDGFPGGTLGVSVRALKPLIASAREKQR